MLSISNVANTLPADMKCCNDGIYIRNIDCHSYIAGDSTYYVDVYECDCCGARYLRVFSVRDF